MPEITLTVEHKVGLHARPASLFVETANQFESDISVQHGDKRANAKSVLSVLTLGVGQGDKITISSDGDDAQEALDALNSLIQKNFEVET